MTQLTISSVTVASLLLDPRNGHCVTQTLRNAVKEKLSAEHNFVRNKKKSIIIGSFRCDDDVDLKLSKVSQSGAAGGRVMPLQTGSRMTTPTIEVIEISFANLANYHSNFFCQFCTQGRTFA